MPEKSAIFNGVSPNIEHQQNGHFDIITFILLIALNLTQQFSLIFGLMQISHLYYTLNLAFFRKPFTFGYTGKLIKLNTPASLR